MLRLLQSTSINFSSLSLSPSLFLTHTFIHSLYVSYSLSLRAYARMGTAYVKQDKLSEALKAYDHSLAKQQNADVVKKKNEVSTFES